MATRTLEVLIDDLDGTPATQTVPFGLDGVTYDVDLSAENADRLREFLEPFISSGRRTGGRRKPTQVHTDAADLLAAAVTPAPSTAKSPKSEKTKSAKKGKRPPRTAGASASARNGKADPGRLKKIRAWAGENGHEVSPRGRIPSAIQEAYDAHQAEAVNA